MQKIIAAAVLFFSFYSYGFCAADKMLCFKNICIQVEIAQTDSERQVGLMSRPKLEDSRGMLFVFAQPDRYPFWMKNVVIPLDMIWIDEDKTIVDIKANVQPCLQEPCENLVPIAAAKYVLEVNGGSAKKWGIKTGDRVNF